jgi:hypothetical protein
MSSHITTWTSTWFQLFSSDKDIPKVAGIFTRVCVCTNSLNVTHDEKILLFEGKPTTNKTYYIYKCWIFFFPTKYFAIIFSIKYLIFALTISNYWIQKICTHTFSSDKDIPKVAGHGQDSWKRGVDGFSYFRWFSVMLFSNQNHLCYMIYQSSPPSFVVWKIANICHKCVKVGAIKTTWQPFN